MKAPTGHYRKIIGEQYPNVRIAFTDTPMFGVRRIKTENVLKVLVESKDPFAPYYVDGLRNGTMIPIVEQQYSDRYFKSGELYFNT